MKASTSAVELAVSIDVEGDVLTSLALRWAFGGFCFFSLGLRDLEVSLIMVGGSWLGSNYHAN